MSGNPNLTKVQLAEMLQQTQVDHDAAVDENRELAAEVRRLSEELRRAQTGIPKVKLKQPTYEDEQTVKGHRRPPAIWSVYLNAVDGYGPPLEVLDMALTGADTLWLGISAYAEDHDSKAITRVAEIAVDVDALYELIEVMVRDSKRTAQRTRLD